MQNHILTPAQNRFPFLHFNHLKDHQPLKKSILCFFAVFLTGLLYGQTYDSGSGTFVVPEPLSPTSMQPHGAVAVVAVGPITVIEEEMAVAVVAQLLPKLPFPLEIILAIP